MKLSKSKLALAKVINENGGLADDSVYAANDEGGIICGYSSKPNRSKLTSYFWSGGQRNTWIRGIKTPQWHQCVLSREEYYKAYPKADADGWIEWKGGECPVGKNVTGDIKLACGEKFDTTDMAMWNWHLGNDNPRSIIAYRLHKPEQSLGSSIGREKFASGKIDTGSLAVATTIEQMAADYRNAKDYAERKQQEADVAKADADAKLKALELAGEALGLLVSPIADRKQPELVITDWRDLQANDVIFVGEYDGHESGEYVVVSLEDDDYDGDYAVMATGIDGCDRWIDTTVEWRFIRRP